MSSSSPSTKLAATIFSLMFPSTITIANNAQHNGSPPAMDGAIGGNELKDVMGSHAKVNATKQRAQSVDTEAGPPASPLRRSGSQLILTDRKRIPAKGGSQIGMSSLGSTGGAALVAQLKENGTPSPLSTSSASSTSNTSPSNASTSAAPTVGSAPASASTLLSRPSSSSTPTTPTTSPTGAYSAGININQSLSNATNANNATLGSEQAGRPLTLSAPPPRVQTTPETGFQHHISDPAVGLWNSFLSGIGLSAPKGTTQDNKDKDKDKNLARIHQQQQQQKQQQLLLQKEKERHLREQEKEKERKSGPSKMPTPESIVPPYGVYTSGLEFYHLFELGPTEKLMADYSCSALTVDSILSGKCYFSRSYFSFHAQRGKQQILVMIPWVEMKELRLAPNRPPFTTIQIFSSDGKVHQFVNFPSAIDTIFNLMQFIAVCAVAHSQSNLQVRHNGNAVIIGEALAGTTSSLGPVVFSSSESDQDQPPRLELVTSSPKSPKRTHRRSGSTI